MASLFAEPVIHAPGISHFVFAIVTVAVFTPCDIVVRRRLRARLDRAHMAVFAFVQFALPCLRADFSLGLAIAYVVWAVFRRNEGPPWRKWRDGLSNRLSGLTEVASAALRREQSQALS
jgi:uncharacterized membrane protein YhaH (DUF805 family)